jgi:hypothetical protein
VLANGNGFRQLIRQCGELPLLLCLFFALLVAGQLGVPGCPVHYLTGHSCPTCGTTRSIVAILNGHFAHAWVLNPIGFIVVIAFAKRCGELFGPSALRRILDYQPIDLTLLAAFLFFSVVNVID